jgi:hypothetical protein
MSAIDLRGAARDFVRGSFVVLRESRVVPPPRFNFFMSVGHEYFGPEIMGIEEYGRLESAMDAAFPARFADPLERPDPEFASTYIFSLLSAAIVLCARLDDFSPESTGISAAVDELIQVLESPDYEVVCCRAVSHLTSGADVLQLDDVSVHPEVEHTRDLARAIAEQVPGGG